MSLRGGYSVQDELLGEYDGLHPDSGPMDFPDNYGGQYWDLGLGLSATVPDGYLAGNHFAFEWLEPIHDEAVTQNKPVGAHMAANAGRAADALLGITDAKAKNAKSGGVKGTYEKLRPTAKKHVEQAIPRLGRLVEKHAG